MLFCRSFTELYCAYSTVNEFIFSPWILVKMPLFSTSHPSQFLAGCNAIDSIPGACRQLRTMEMFGFYHICCFILNTIERLLSNCGIKLLSSQQIKPRQSDLVSFLFGISSSFGLLLFQVPIQRYFRKKQHTQLLHITLHPTRVLFAFPSIFSRSSQRKSRDPLH